MAVVAAFVAQAQERLIHQAHQGAWGGAGHLPGCVASEPCPEDGQLPEHPLLIFAEEPPGVLEHGPDAAVAVRQVAGGAGEEVEAPFDL